MVQNDVEVVVHRVVVRVAGGRARPACFRVADRGKPHILADGLKPPIWSHNNAESTKSRYAAHSHSTQLRYRDIAHIHSTVTVTTIMKPRVFL